MPDFPRSVASMTTTAPAPASGLVICATTARGSSGLVDVSVPDDPSSLLTAYAPHFPTSQDVDSAAREFAALESWGGHEGPRARVVVSPGTVGIHRRDLARRERALERAATRQEHAQNELAAYFARHGEWPPAPESRRVVERWSRRSRARMTEALSQLDYSSMLRPGVVPALVTLTYPGDWLAVAPTGAAVKRHVRMLQKAYKRAWGAEMVGVWKLEFQRRGAPHYHIFMVPPRGLAHVSVAGGRLRFKEWLSLTWANIVAAAGTDYVLHLARGTGVDFAEGLRQSDPRRVAVYFTKHGHGGAKEYQNVVPEAWRAPGAGPGRFWGYWGLTRLRRAAELAPDAAIWASRLLRRYARANAGGVTRLEKGKGPRRVCVDHPGGCGGIVRERAPTTREATVRRTAGGQPVAATWDVIGLAGAQLLAGGQPIRKRRVRRRVQRMKGGAGWLSVNDGPALARDLARFLSTINEGESYA